MNYPTINKQSGSVLAISLVLLTAITILAVMNMQRTGLQTRIAGNVLHRELLFNTDLNEQECVFFQLKTANTGDPMLSGPIRSFNLDADGTRVYTPVFPAICNPLPPFIQATNQLLLLGSTPGVIALAQGEEGGDRILFRYQLQSQAGIANRTRGRTMSDTQITGLSFPGLNTGKNSLF